MEMKIILVVLTFLSAQPTQSIRQSNQLLLSVAQSMEQELLIRNKRQTVRDPQGFNVRNAQLNIPVPVNIAHYPGEDARTDNCRRDEVIVEPKYNYGKPKCMKLLQRGNCNHDQVVLMDPETRKGYCAPRLCPPDRIFVHATQLCHDPQDTDVCPGGRELFNTAHGSAICDCPDGTTESSNGMYGDVCEVLLTENRLCKKGQIYWFKDFNGFPQCLDDPCGGKNLKRRPNSLQFVPSQLNGECYQLGQTTGVCQPGLIYALHLPSLKGVCETLENLGFDMLTQEELSALNRIYGITIVKTNSLSPSFGQNLISSSLEQNSISSFGQGSHASSFGQVPHASSFGQVSHASPFGQVSHSSSFGQVSHASSFGQNALFQSIGQPITDTRYQGTQFSHEQVQNANLIMSDFGLTFLRTLGFKSPPIPGILVYHVTIRPSGEVITHVLPYSRSVRSTIEHENEIGETFTFTSEDLKRLLESDKLSKEDSQVAKAIFQSAKRYPVPDATIESNGSGHVLPAKLIGKNYTPSNEGNESNTSGQVVPAELIGKNYTPSNEGNESNRAGQVVPAELIGKNYTPSNEGNESNIAGQVVPAELIGKNYTPSNKGSETNRAGQVIPAEFISNQTLSRKRRQVQPHASPSNVFETRLQSCSAGAARDLNAKCRDTVLPASIPKSRGVRAAPPIAPTPSCSAGQAYNFRRMCSSASSVQNSNIARTLG